MAGWRGLNYKPTSAALHHDQGGGCDSFGLDAQRAQFRQRAAFGEGIQICLMLPIPRGMGAEIVKIARGEPA